MSCQLEIPIPQTAGFCQFEYVSDSFDRGKSDERNQWKDFTNYKKHLCTYRACVFGMNSDISSLVLCLPCVLQLRVIRAFKSTLEDLEERRSIHSLRSTRSRPLSDITYIDEDPGKAPCYITNSTISATFGPPIHKTPSCEDPHRPHYCEGHSTPYLFYTLPKIPYETSI